LYDARSALTLPNP